MRDQEPQNSGFVRLSRQFFNHSFWKEQRPYSTAEAWLDIISTARFETKPEKLLVKMNLITIERGELRASQRYLNKRWNRSLGWVNRFLRVLKNEQMITIRREHSESIIKVLNYSKFNPLVYLDNEQLEEQSLNGNGSAFGTPTGTATEHQQVQTKEYKEREEGKEGERENSQNSNYLDLSVNINQDRCIITCFFLFLFFQSKFYGFLLFFIVFLIF